MVLTNEQKNLSDILANKIKDNKKNIRETSLKQYISILRKFIERTGINHEDINNDPDMIIKKFNNIDDLSDNTKKNILISFMVYSNNSAKKIYEPLLNLYNKKYTDKMDKGQYNSETQKQKSEISFNQLENVLTDYKNEAFAILKNNPKEITNIQHDTLTNYLLLELYLGNWTSPTRNDYREIKLFNKKNTKEIITDKTNNYYIIPTGTFIINNYKTSDKHGSIIFNVPDNIKKFIKKYISFSPNVLYLFYNQNNKPYSTSSFTNKLNKIFKNKLGINISTTAIRSIYLTHKYGNIKKEMKNDANIMGHSIDVAMNVYNKA